jgi:hypothetical protein
MQLEEAITPGPWEGSGSTETVEWLANLLCTDGVNLAEVTEEQLRRGTPVYVDDSADLDEVQRLMARHHIRMLPVVAHGSLVGVVDILKLARLYDSPGDSPGSDAATA